MNKKKEEQNNTGPFAAAETEAGETPAEATAGRGSMEVIEAKTVTLLASEFEELKVKAAKADECWDRLIRQTADLDNYKKRVARERQEASKFAAEALIAKLIPILDNFEMAQSAANSAQAASVESLRTGITLIYQQLKGVLRDAGVEEMDATNKAFDPNWQEAVSEQKTSEVPEGQVVQQLRKGYKLRDRLLRPATVVVARKPEA